MGKTISTLSTRTASREAINKGKKKKKKKKKKKRKKKKKKKRRGPLLLFLSQVETVYIRGQKRKGEPDHFT